MLMKADVNVDLVTKMRRTMSYDLQERSGRIKGVDTHLYPTAIAPSMAGIDADVFKALSDGNRLTILRILSDGEICACRILEALDITQPTLSHHMKILCDSGLVKARRSGQWSYYSIDRDRLEELKDFIDSLRSC